MIEPASMMEAFGEEAIRESIRMAFQYLRERLAKADIANIKPENTPILSERATTDALLQRYKSMAIGNKVVGAIKTEEDLQEQLAWYESMIPIIVESEFTRYKKENGGEKVANEEE